MKYIRILSIIFIGLALSACGDKDNSEPPAELISFTPEINLDLLWGERAIEGVNQQFLFLTPMLEKDRIVLAGRDGNIKSLTLDTGDELTDINLDVTLSAGIGGDDKLWLLATRDARVLAVNAKDGKVLWSVRVPSEVLARPLLHQGAVIVRTVDGQVLSLDASNGKARWTYQQVLPALTLRGNSEPLLARDTIFVGLDNGRAIALSAKTGEVLWDIVLAAPEGRSEIQRLVDVDGQAELYGRVLYATSYQGRLAAIDVERGQFLWTRPFSSYSGISIDDKAIYSTDDRGHIWAIDRLNGATLWKQDALTARDVTRPTLLGDYLVVGDYAGYLHVLSKFDGHFVGRVLSGNQDNDSEFSFGSSGILVPPLVKDQKVFVTTRDGSIYVYAYTPLNQPVATAK